MSVRHKIHYSITPFTWSDSIVLCGSYFAKHETSNKICVTCKECLKILKEESE